jgi:hypothetical protein
MSNIAKGRQDCLVDAVWEAKVSGQNWSEDGPKSLDNNVLEERLSQLMGVLVIHHGLEEFYALTLKKLKDLRVFINLHLLLVYGSRARTEGWIE